MSPSDTDGLSSEFLFLESDLELRSFEIKTRHECEEHRT